MTRYPRDFTGYGSTPPDAAWPNGARIAVQFVLNYEEGGENCLLHGDAASEAFLSEIVGAQPWPGQRHWNMESIYDYGARAGFWRLHRLFKGAQVPVTVYGVASALARAPEQVEAMKTAGWEIASHGLKWIDYKDHTPEAEQADMDEAIRLHTAKMMSIGLHCRLIGRPGRVQALRRFLEYIQGFEGVWTPRRIEIAEHWRATHPPLTSRLRPSQLSQKDFVAAFGGVFEHSSWIAERAFELELGPAHDSAVGVHSALARMFRSASHRERLGVLTAHPDLAGKLAAAKRLTVESTSEQASAGLDSLTDAERAAFQELNTAYVAKHGFPFIIAVKDHDKAGILRAFKSRIANDTAVEFKTACTQVERIARLRLEDMF